MCQFCVEHGEGERWYLNAKNYAYDLQSDLQRRNYVVKFVRGFGDMRANAITWMGRFEKLPEPLARAGKSAISRHMQTHHFGQPLPIEDCAQVFDLATSITVIPCICRMHTPGKNADEVCMLVTTQPIADVLEEGFRDYANGPHLNDFHTMTKNEAMELLADCEQRGLMHSIWTFDTPFTAAICNCNIESGCMAMKMTQGYELKMMWRGETVAQLSDEQCVACGKCAKVCPFDAIEARKGSVTLHQDACWGCGICRAACSKDAISLIDRRHVPSVAALW
ncbi:MAG TPA: 4Fe-4S dicluster-binding protein [Coriobacteriia bacterium]|nr:4Fe-4S dicluster-binding protein [Coriobacteriia bacterium]